MSCPSVSTQTHSKHSKWQFYFAQTLMDKMLRTHVEAWREKRRDWKLGQKMGIQEMALVRGCAVWHSPSAKHWPQRALYLCPSSQSLMGAVWKGRGLKGRGLQGFFQVKVCFAQYIQPVPVPSSLQTRCSHRPLQLLEFNYIKTLPSWALMCRMFAELAADGPTRNSGIPVWLQEKAEREGAPIHLPLPIRWL